MYCPSCGNEITENQLFCSACGARLTAEVGSQHTAGTRKKNPWEDRESLGFPHGIMMTVRQVLSAPSLFFRNMMTSGGMSDPLIYALIVGMIGLAALYGWDMLLHDQLKTYMTPEFRAASERSMILNRGSFLAYFLTPFLFIMWLFIAAGALHLMLLLTSGGRAGFEATFRVVCYSITPAVFLTIPACGTPVTLIWTVILSIIGVKEAHEISGAKAIVSVLMPFFLFCCMLAAVVVLVIGAAAASFGALMQMNP